LKFSIIKRIQFGKNNKKTKFPNISIHNNQPLQKTNQRTMDENAEDERETSANNDEQETKNTEIAKDRSNMATDKESQQPEGAKKEGQDEEEEEICIYCKEKLVDEGKRPHWKWNMDRDTRFCPKCYSIKETEYEKLMSNCSVCNSRLNFIRYNPKPEWKLKGQLCRKCWDSQNFKFKNDKK
jgi:NADH pyrophosphatase NudC (nudix superfamily)